MTSPTIFLFANNAQSTLAAPITNVATTLTLAAGGGALFPNPSAGQQFTLTLNDAATGDVYEIMYCTARSSDTLTVTRGQEGTAAVAWLAGDLAANFLTAQTAAFFTQPKQLQAQAGNYATDTGAANAYVVALDPVVTAYTNGLSFEVYFIHTNTGAATLNAGGGAVSLRRNDGQVLLANDIIAGSLWRVTYVTALGQFLMASGPLAVAAHYTAADTNVQQGTWLVDTSVASITMTLPASPITPMMITFIDAKGTWGVNTPYFDPGAHQIENTPGVFDCLRNGVQFSVYWDPTGTPTWRLV